MVSACACQFHSLVAMVFRAQLRKISHIVKFDLACRVCFATSGLTIN